MLLTIAIPSFNRSEAALKTLQNLAGTSQIPDEVQLLFANNGSLDEGYAQIDEFLRCRPNARYLNYQDNLGFSGNFLRLVGNCESKYVLVMSDEDDLDVSGIQTLLENLKTYSPNLYILRNISSKPNTITKLRASNLKGSSNYISGMIFNLEAIRPFLPKISEIISEEEFGRLYPQVILGLVLFSLGQSFLCSSPTIHFRTQLPSTIRASSGNPYWHPTERVYQYLSMNRCIDKLALNLVNGDEKKLMSFKKANRRKFFGLIFDAIETINPAIMTDFTRSSFLTSVNLEVRRIRKKFKN